MTTETTQPTAEALMAAEAAGLRPAFARVLQGDSYEEMLEDAKQFAKNAAPPPPEIELPDLHAGARETASAPQATGWFDKRPGTLLGRGKR